MNESKGKKRKGIAQILNEAREARCPYCSTSDPAEKMRLVRENVMREVEKEKENATS